jgi:hypothetical protein
MSRDEHISLAAGLCAENGRFNSGIVVFSSTRKALYMNEAAQQLLSRLNRAEDGDSPLPRSVDNLLDEILLVLRIGASDPGWKQLAARRFAMAPDRSVLVKTFGMPDRQDSQRSLIVLTIQETHAS